MGSNHLKGTQVYKSLSERENEMPILEFKCPAGHITERLIEPHRVKSYRKNGGKP